MKCLMWIHKIILDPKYNNYVVPTKIQSSVYVFYD